MTHIFKAQCGERVYFPHLHFSSYMNHASISPPSTPVQQAIADCVKDIGKRGAAAFMDYLSQRDELRSMLAQLFSVEPNSSRSPSAKYVPSAQDFALCPNTTLGLQMIAHAFPWKTGDAILLFRGEFPTNITPWLQAAKRSHLRVIWASLEPLGQKTHPDWSEIDQALSQGVKLVAISAVQFQTGLRVPQRILAHKCHAWGAQLCVDGIQACGSTPIPIDQIDYLACGGHKWMMGVEGAGFLYIHPKRLTALHPQISGWLSHREPFDFLFQPEGRILYNKPLRSETSAFEGGTQSSIGYAALWASTQLLCSLGVSQIYAHIQSLLDPLEEGLISRGFQSARLPDIERRSGILSVRPPTSLNVVQWAEALDRQKISCATPNGWLRFSPHWPNAHEEISIILSVVDEMIANL